MHGFMLPTEQAISAGLTHSCLFRRFSQVPTKNNTTTVRIDRPRNKPAGEGIIARVVSIVDMHTVPHPRESLRLSLRTGTNAW